MSTVPKKGKDFPTAPALREEHRDSISPPADSRNGSTRVSEHFQPNPRLLKIIGGMNRDF